MKTITHLTGVAAEAPAPNLHAGFSLHEEPVPGFTRQLRCGITGVILRSGESALLIPTQALWDLAAAIDPAFIPPPPPPAKASRVNGRATAPVPPS